MWDRVRKLTCEEFIARMSREGMPLDTITALLRYASTLQRLAVASCNGDYPSDNGERQTTECPECQSRWAPASFKRPPQYAHALCPDCYIEAKVRTAAPAAWTPIFGGDPRGAVLGLVPAGTPQADIDSGRERGIYVPARSR